MAIIEFPPIDDCDEDGFLAVGGDLEIPSLLLAYSQAIFPWPSDENQPIPWFSPDPRGVLHYKDLIIHKSLQKIMKKNIFQITFNKDFPKVINSCAQTHSKKSSQGTWITPAMIEAYTELHYAGHAYSVESWYENELVGGIYGVTINGFISAESMFYRESNASKIALLALLHHLHSKGIDWIDTQMITPVTADFGGKEISRKDFIEMLKMAITKQTAPWAENAID